MAPKYTGSTAVRLDRLEEDFRPHHAPDNQSPDTDGISFRRATHEDGAAIWKLVDESGALDANSPYAYLMMGKWFSDTCVVAENENDEIVGFVIGFVPPRQRDTAFVWQIGVDEKSRSRGLGRRLLNSFADHAPGVRFVEATVTPSNDASEALFRGFARSRNALCAVSDIFPAEAFPTEGHECERLFRIGPLKHRSA